MGAFTQCDKELGAVRVGALVGHTEKTLGIERPPKVFVGKGAAIYGFAPSAITFGEVCDCM